MSTWHNYGSYSGGAIDFDDAIGREGRLSDAIAGTNSNASLGNVNFTSNKAEIGGAIELCNGVINTNQVKFTSNMADYCGAIEIRGVDSTSAFNILDANGKHFADYFTNNHGDTGKSILIWREQHFYPDSLLNEGIQNGEISADYIAS